jgi:hypothetical protein
VNCQLVLGLVGQFELSDRKSKHVKSVIELIGAIAVLIGLVFVGLELRQNTAAVQAATFQGMTGTSSDFLVTVASVPELRRVWVAAHASPKNLNSEDLQILALLQQSLWLRMQNAFRQWQIGTLSDEDWLVYQKIVCSFAQRPLFQDYWRNSGSLTARFKEMLEDCDK